MMSGLKISQGNPKVTENNRRCEMKDSTAWKFSLATVLMSLLTVTFVFAQRTDQRRGLPRYDPNTEATVTGLVQEVKQVSGSKGWSGTHLMSANVLPTSESRAPASQPVSSGGRPAM